MGSRGLKSCPKCETKNGPRAFKCKKCGHDFKPGSSRKTTEPVGVRRGQKPCPQCDKTCGPRSYACPYCQFKFVEAKPKATTEPKKKKRRGKIPVKDWQSIKVGSRIKVLKGSGDYYISKESGEKVYMQDAGIYYVEGVNTDGLVVRGKNGHGFIYMGEPTMSSTLRSIHKEPAKLVLFV